MDKFGVPKKINRHVIKAIYQLSDQGLDNLDLLNICDRVELNMRNNVPVANFLGEVRLSLQNLCKLGVITKKGKYYYKSSENTESLPTSSTKRVGSRTIRDQNKNKLNPNNRKKRVLSNESIPENDPESSIKRFRTSKTLSRKGKNVPLPKVRMHNFTIPTHYYPSDITGEMKQDSDSNSSYGDGNRSEDENEQIFSSKTESEMKEEKEFDKVKANAENRLETFSNNSNQKTNSQDNKHTKPDEVSNENTKNGLESPSNNSNSRSDEVSTTGDSSDQNTDSQIQNDQLKKHEKVFDENHHN